MNSEDLCRHVKRDFLIRQQRTKQNASTVLNDALTCCGSRLAAFFDFAATSKRRLKCVLLATQSLT